MADVITRFKLETTQFDSKLRDASKGLKEYTHQAELGGKSFTDFSQKSIEAARSLGTIASGANNAKDKVKDLVGAYNDAANAYNKLSQEQQQSEFGKALAQSIGQLSDRLKEAKQELYGLGDAVNKVKSGGLFGEGGLTGMLAVTGGNLLASGLSKLGSELADTVQQSIELARQGEGVRLAFDRLNQPGLLDNLKEATHGTVSELELMKQAIKFDNFKLPLEDLATYLAFAQQKAKDTGESIDYLVNSIVTGLGRQSKQILDNLGISAAELTRRMNEGADMTKAVADIIREEMAKAGDYVETAADRAARAAADAANKMEEIGRQAMPVAEEWAQAWNEIKLGGMELLNLVLGPVADSIRSIREILNGDFEINVKANIPNLAEGSNIDDNGNYIKRPAQKGAAGFDWENGTWKTGYSGAIYNSATGQTELPEVYVTGTKPTTPKKKTKGGSKKTTDQTARIQQQFDTAMANANIAAEELKFPDLTGPSEAWETFRSAIVKGSEEIGDSMNFTKWTKNFDPYTEKMNEMTKALKQQQMAFSMAAQAASNFGAALSSLDDPGAKAAGTVIAAIANIALGFGTAAAQASSMGPWGWIAYVAAGLGTLATAISTVHSLTGYAEGGIVKGNSYSGDNVPALVDGSQMVGLNAGEVVLTAAMTNNLANGIQNRGFGNLNIVGVLEGEKIKLVLNRHLKRTGQGELVTWR